MGLGFSHGDAHWAYSGFNIFRTRLAKEIGICLPLMEGFWIKGSEFATGSVELTKKLVGQDVMDKFYWLPEEPLKWNKIKDDIVPFLYHSDCEGKLTVSQCKKIVPRLKKLIQEWPEDDYDKQQALKLIEGMEECIKLKKQLLFC